MTQMDDAASPPNNNVKGALFGLAAFGLFATHDAAIKVLGGTYTPFQVVFFIVLLSFPLLSLMLVGDASTGNLRPVHPWWTALRTVAVVITGFCAFYSFSVLPLAQVYSILFAAPLIITVLSIPILGEVVRRHRWVAVVLGLVGVMVVLQPGTVPLTLGHLAAMIAAIGGALASVIMRKIGNEERRVVMLIYPLLANFAVMLCVLPFVYIPVPMQDLGLFMFVAVLAVSASSLMIRAYQQADAAIVAPMQYSQIIWATVFGLLFFDEIPTLATALGAGIIIVSGAYIVLRESGGSSRNRPVLNTFMRRPDTGTSPRVRPPNFKPATSDKTE